MQQPLNARAYRTKPDVLAAKLEGEIVLLHLGTKEYHRLNETAAVVWNAIEKTGDAGAAVESLVQQFDVDRDTAAAAVTRTLDDLLARKLIEKSIEPAS